MNAKEAVAVAIDYLRTFPDLVPSDAFRLEETELEDNGNWAITLSYSDLEAVMKGERIYKRFVISPKKEIVSMKIRNPIAA